MDKFNQLQQEIQELKQQQTSDHQDLLAGLVVQRDKTREVGGMMRLLGDQMLQMGKQMQTISEKVDGVADEQSKSEARLKNTEDRWAKLFGALEQMVLELRRQVATKDELAAVIRRLEALEQQPPAA
ncbi:MAG: hypothetical protein AMXMBFR33_08470 [Candidatus Xenobia bacterium]